MYFLFFLLNKLWWLVKPRRWMYMWMQYPRWATSLLSSKQPCIEVAYQHMHPQVFPHLLLNKSWWLVKPRRWMNMWMQYPRWATSLLLSKQPCIEVAYQHMHPKVFPPLLLNKSWWLAKPRRWMCMWIQHPGRLGCFWAALHDNRLTWPRLTTLSIHMHTSAYAKHWECVARSELMGCSI